MRKIFILVLVIAALGTSATVIGLSWKAHQSLQNGMVTLKGIVVKDFHDPESARFRSISLRSMQGTISDRLRSVDAKKLLLQSTPAEALSIFQYDPKAFELCGEVNAKNSFGAYIGYKRFYISAYGSQTPFIDAHEGDRLAEKMCDIGKGLVVLAED